MRKLLTDLIYLPDTPQPPNPGEKPFTCAICGMSFVRNDLMLRHGRLKHKTNLKKHRQPVEQIEVEVVRPVEVQVDHQPPPDGLHTLA